MQYLLTSPLHAKDADLGDKCQIMLSMGEFCLTAHVDCNGQKLVVKLARDLLTDQSCTGPLLSLTQSNATDRNLQVYFRTDYTVNRLLLCTRITLSCKRFEHPGHAHVLRYVGHDAASTCIFSEAYEGSLHSVMRQPYFRPTCEDTWVNLLGQVLLGLRYLHAVASVYHRNLHPQALVFDTQGHPRNWQWRIADFGGAMVVPTADMEHYALDVVIMVQWLLLERLFQVKLASSPLPLLLHFHELAKQSRQRDTCCCQAT